MHIALSIASFALEYGIIWKELINASGTIAKSTKEIYEIEISILFVSFEGYVEPDQAKLWCIVSILHPVLCVVHCIIINRMSNLRNRELNHSCLLISSIT